VAARAEIAAGAGDDDRLDAFVACRGAEDVGEFAIALEGQRILSLRPIERDGGDQLRDLQTHVLRRVVFNRQRHRIGVGHRGGTPAIALRADVLALARSRINVSTSPGASWENTSA